MIKNINMKRIKDYLLAIAASLVIAGCASEAAENNAPATGPQKLPVDVMVATARPLIQEEILPGSLLPNREVTIMSEVSRKVETIAFRDGTLVRQGQLLYRLDNKDITAKLKQTEAELSLAKLNERRLAELLAGEAVRQEEYDVAKTRLESLEASKEILLADLDKTSIYAPFSGFIGISKVQSGALVSPGVPLVTIQEQGTIKVQFTIPEKHFQLITSGKQIFFSVSGKKEKFAARIIGTEPGIDPQSRTIVVHAITSNHDTRLTPGMSAQVYFPTAPEGTSAITIPTEALIPGEGGYNVFAVKSGKAKMTPVQISNRDESHALITSGIANGDTIMISNILRSGEGTPVQIVTVK
jgi:membrane fusion protein, multidrug efflux system